MIRRRNASRAGLSPGGRREPVHLGNHSSTRATVQRERNSRSELARTRRAPVTRNAVSTGRVSASKLSHALTAAGSTTNSPAMSVYPSCAAARVNVTRRDSPALSDTRVNPASCWAGRVAPAVFTLTYSYTTVSPARSPVLVTVAAICASPLVVIWESAEMSERAKEV